MSRTRAGTTSCDSDESPTMGGPRKQIDRWSLNEEMSFSSFVFFFFFTFYTFCCYYFLKRIFFAIGPTLIPSPPSSPCRLRNADDLSTYYLPVTQRDGPGLFFF